MSSFPEQSKSRRTGLWVTGTLLILCLLISVGYLAFQSLPVFYQTPSVKKRIEWQQLPQPLVIKPEIQTWSSAKNVVDVVWTNEIIWLATMGGVIAHDRNSGEQVKFLPEHGLPSTDMTTITTDVSGNIWVGTADSGIARYDGLSWERFGPGSGLPSGEIRDLYAAPDGVIWAATSSGLARFSGEAWAPVRFSLLGASRIDATGVIGFGDVVWASSRDGIYRFNGDRWDYFGLNEGLINENVEAITLTPDLNLWAATPSGLSRFNGSRWERFTVRHGLPDAPALDILGAPDNSVWITFGQRDDFSTYQTVRFDGLAVHSVSKLPVNQLVTYSNDLWLATVDGLSDSSNPQSAPIIGISDFPHAEMTELIQTENGVAIVGSQGISFFEDGRWQTVERVAVGGAKIADDGRLALAGEHPSEGVTLLNPDGSEQHLACETAGINAGNLYAITEAPDGAIWILGTENIGRYHQGRWRYFTDGLPAEYAPRKIVSDRFGDIWLGLEEGLYRLNNASQSWELYDPRTVQRMTASPNGNLWLVADNQLLHFADDQFKRFPLPEVDGVSRGFVANNAGLWISSQNGVAHLAIDGTWQLFTAADGLATDDVTTLTIDDDGDVWAAYADARFGVSQFVDGRWEIVHNVIDPDEPNNGHQGFNAPRRDEVVSISVLPSNQIWFGTYFGDIGRLAPNELLYEPEDYRLYFANMTALHPASDGTLWFVGWGGRLGRLYPEAITGEDEIWRIHDSTLETTQVHDVVVQDGVAWLATEDGVAVIDQDECRMVAHREDLAVVAGEINPADGSIWWATRKNGGLMLDTELEKLDWPILHLRGRRFIDMVKAPDDSLWFVSNSELIRLDGTDRRVQTLEGLGDVKAVAIAADLRPWVATDQGVASLSRGTWELQGTADGLPTNALVDILIVDDGAVWVMGKSSISQSR